MICYSYSDFLSAAGLRKRGGQMGKIESNTPYDDVCRTLVVECDDLVIPLINELFGEHYSLSDRIIRRGNEHFIEQTVQS